MALRYKTIKSIEQRAERLEKWANEIGSEWRQKRPQNTRELRQIFDNNKPFPHLTWQLNYHSSLAESLGGYNYILEELQQYMPNMAKSVQKQHDDLLRTAKLVGRLNVGSCEWFRKVNDSRDIATHLAETLQHLAEIARKERNEAKRVRVKKIFYYSIGFLAALLTCIYILWWLWTKIFSGPA